MTEEVVVEGVEDMQEVEEFSIDELAETKTEGIDLDKFEGNKVNIAGMSIIQVPSKFHDSGRANVLKVWTEPVGDVTFGENNTPLVASELFNLKVVDGKPAWSDRGALAELLAKKSIAHPRELNGKQVMLRIRLKKSEGSKFPRKFLGFV